ncbi:hypothetical protein F5X96DRAFT_633093 [Biscogniauxia mediterranea]|nr:hypothetical protein F5X96DRAFT_633093 [Biscogniauxia mediterranea]
MLAHGPRHHRHGLPGGPRYTHKSPRWKRCEVDITYTLYLLLSPIRRMGDRSRGIEIIYHRMMMITYQRRCGGMTDSHQTERHQVFFSLSFLFLFGHDRDGSSNLPFMVQINNPMLPTRLLGRRFVGHSTSSKRRGLGFQIHGTYLHIYIHTHTHTYKHTTLTDIHTHARTLTHTHTHIHTPNVTIVHTYLHLWSR